MASAEAVIDAAALARLQTWEGRSETAADRITPVPLRALSATLDRDDTEAVDGARVPELWHWLFFLPLHRQSALGPDGHARRGGFLPPVPLPRRMWAGGRVRWAADNPLRVGDRIERRSTIQSLAHRIGRSGELLFVVVRHEIANDRGPALTEEHDIVYRAEPPRDAAAAPATGAGQSTAGVPAPTDAAFGRRIEPDDVLLFRYSALTFNGHRIHYDRRYVTEVEGYPGLVVHGPLIATLLVDLLRRQHPALALARFDYRALRPTFDTAPFGLQGRPTGERSFALWATDADGLLTMQASAEAHA